MRRAVLAALLGACAAPRPAPPTAIFGVVEGHIVDARTGKGLAGVEVMFDGPCKAGDEIGETITDEYGHYRIELRPGVCDLGASFGDASVDRDGVEIVRDRTTRVDLRLDHDQVVAAWKAKETMACPSSPPRTIIEGHTTSSADLDDVARAVLERMAVDETTIVSVDVFGSRVSDPWRRLSARAFPSARFVAKGRAQLQADADRTGRDVRFIQFSGLDSDGTCAIVLVGEVVLLPTRDARSVCTCSATEIYEKRRGRWTFVRKAYVSCAG